MAKTLEQILGGQPNNYNPSLQVQQTPAQQPAANQQESTEQKPMSYADLFVATNPYRPQTAEEREAERKRNRRNAVFAAIGDGISALSNLYFTTKGAPNAYTGGSTLSGKLYERQEQLRKERQALDQQYFNAYMNALKMDADEEYKNQNLKLQLENLAYNRAKYDNEQAYKRERDAKQDAKDERRYNLDVEKFNQKKDYDSKRLSRMGSGSGSRATAPKTEGFDWGGSHYDIPTSYWTNRTVPLLWEKLTPEQQQSVMTLDSNGNPKKLTMADMISAIVLNAENNPEILKEFGRFKTGQPTNLVERASGNAQTSLLPGAASGNQTTLLP